MKRIVIISLCFFLMQSSAAEDETPVTKAKEAAQESASSQKLTDADIQKALQGLGSSLFSTGRSWVRRHPVESAGLLTFLLHVPFGKAFSSVKFLTILGTFYYGNLYQDEILKQIRSYKK